MPFNTHLTMQSVHTMRSMFFYIYRFIFLVVIVVLIFLFFLYSFCTISIYTLSFYKCDMITRFSCMPQIVWLQYIHPFYQIFFHIHILSFALNLFLSLWFDTCFDFNRAISTTHRLYWHVLHSSYVWCQRWKIECANDMQFRWIFLTSRQTNAK